MSFYLLVDMFLTVGGMALLILIGLYALNAPKAQNGGEWALNMLTVVLGAFLGAVMCATGLFGLTG